MGGRKSFEGRMMINMAFLQSTLEKEDNTHNAEETPKACLLFPRLLPHRNSVPRAIKEDKFRTFRLLSSCLSTSTAGNGCVCTTSGTRTTSSESTSLWTRSIAFAGAESSTSTNVASLSAKLGGTALFNVDFLIVNYVWVGIDGSLEGFDGCKVCKGRVLLYC
jgi:hypothetical protein